MWNKVLLGFDGEEETVNFGCRQMAVYESAVYETNTLAVISKNNDEKETDSLMNIPPQIRCFRFIGNSDSGILIIVNESIIILNYDGSELRSKLSFDAYVDSYVITSDGSLLFVALRNGDIHCSLLKTGENSLFIKNICNSKVQNQNTFVNMFLRQREGKCDLILISRIGNIYILKEVNLTELIKACAARSIVQIKTVIDDAKEDYISVNKTEYDCYKIVSAMEFIRFDEPCILITVQSQEKQELFIWSTNFKIILRIPLLNQIQLKKLQITKSGSLIYGLTTQGSILLMCPYTLTLLHLVKNVSFLDFEMMNEEDGSLLVLTDSMPPMLQLITLPGFKVKFQINVTNMCMLCLAGGQSSLDDLLYLEALYTKLDADSSCCKVFHSIHLKIISESQPEYRLERILRRGKFQEAEDFARAFHLNLETVYKAHLQKLSIDIQPWSEGKVSVVDSGILFKKLLRKVEDIEFVARCALNAISSDLELVKDVLKYVEDLLKSCILKNESRNDMLLQNLYSEVRKLLLRLNTFYAISDKPLNVEKWISFQKANLIDECQVQLKEGKLKDVILIWSRHFHEFKNQLTYEQCLYFFRAIPSSTSVSHILEWLRIFLRNCLSLFPKIISNLVGWCKEKVNIMELLAEPNWTELSIEFLRVVLSIIRMNTEIWPNSSSKLTQYEYAVDSPMEEMLFYIRILTEMSVMKKTHGITITILEYTQANDQEVLFTILDKVPLDELNSFVNGFMQHLLLQKNLNGDTIISEYVQSLVEGSVNWWYWEEAPWEGRVAILLDCIASIQVKLDTVLNVLKYSPVPWSATITGICEQALKHENSVTRLIREQQRMVNCKLVLKKYDLKDIRVIKPHFQRVVQFIFLQGRDSMLEDALQIANTFDAEMCTEVYVLYVQRLIENGEGMKAMAFLEDRALPVKIVACCYNSIILKTHSLSRMSNLSSLYDNYVKELDEVSSKLPKVLSNLKTSGDTITSFASSEMCQQLKNIHYIKRNFKEDVTICHITYPEERDKLMKFCLDIILKRIKADQKSLGNECLKLTRLANCLDCSKEEIYIKFIDLAFSNNEIDTTIFLLRLLLKEDALSVNVSNQVIEIINCVLQHCIQNPKCVSENEIVIYIPQLITASLNSCSLISVSKGLEIVKWFRWIQTPVQLDYSMNSSDKPVFSHADVDVLQTYSRCIDRSTILKLLTAYDLYSRENNLQSNVKYLSSQYTIDMKTISVSLPEILQNIVNQENENVSLQLMINIHWLMLRNCVMSQIDFNEFPIIIKTRNLFQLCISKLLKKLIGSRNLDIHFGTALLNHFPREDASKWILESAKRFKFDYQRLFSITELGMVYFQQKQCENEWNEIYTLRKQCIWGKQVMEYGLSYKEAFRESPSERKQLLLKLMAVPSIDVNVLAKYCRDVNFDFQACLKAYLRQTLLAWEPEFEIKINPVTGDKELIVKQTHKTLLNKCREIINLIENTSELSQLISNIIWDSINYYYYEVYLILLKLMEENATKPSPGLFSTYRNVFLFLLSYQRISKPQEYEREQWFLVYPNTQSLPAISEYRLPFRLLFSRWTKSNNDPWKIIKPELNIRTYSKWFAVLDALELDKNVLCTVAITQMTKGESLSGDSTGHWCIHLRHQKLLADVQKCIDEISSLEMASASLYFVVNHLPPGADQLAAAKLCFLHAQQWVEQEKSEKAEAGFVKCQKKYLTISTTHILYVHNLGKPSYLQLVLNPIELIRALYNDPIILQMKSGNVLVLPDINKASEEISVVHKVDISKIRFQLLEEWLLPENFMMDISASEIENALECGNNTKFCSVDHENFVRSCYVVERDVHTFGRYLVNILFDENTEDSKPISVRLRALQCLFVVSSEDRLEQLTGQNIDKLRDFMNTLKYVTELEMLGLTYSLTSFTSCDKTELAKCLLMIKNTKAVRLASNISLYFCIKTASVWNGILSRMCFYEMIQDLAHVLPALSDFYHLLDLRIFEKAWNITLLTPLLKAPFTLSEDQRTAAEENVKLIYSCPIIDNINIKAIKENCNRIGLQCIAERIENLLF